MAEGILLLWGQDGRFGLRVIKEKLTHRGKERVSEKIG